MTRKTGLLISLICALLVILMSTKLVKWRGEATAGGPSDHRQKAIDDTPP